MDDLQTPPTDADSEGLSAPQSELESLRREVQDKQDRLLRALAETDNVRRRISSTLSATSFYASQLKTCSPLRQVSVPPQPFSQSVPSPPSRKSSPA